MILTFFVSILINIYISYCIYLFNYLSSINLSRLAAIRETFEESGILLYHDPNNKDSKTSTAHTFNCDNKELEAIRKKGLKNFLSTIFMHVL